ncbi:type IV pilus assembly protein PilY1 [Modicisalibacter muralis]|uniref:Type IV pilus assembly protein PilY1 n=1 Tax=Modicisalibacter muralis TaxID=119000 RepID=A0A1G9QKU6_9GAMM|nr:PilC/PilY family type IV pilus protein [Halomonas muralis]SDM11619.1 type IV pilus assembly protein PilY1 [Halomonas muralis]
MSIKGSMTWLTSIALCIIHGMAVAQSVPYKPPPSSQANVKPQSMIVMSNDHQLFYKAYTDFSDLDGDGEIDDTYKDSIRYYGYFDSEGCYEYETDLAGGAFQRGRDTDDDFECNRDDDDDDDDDGGNYWSGNFLNWATMTRMDILRKVLYGGKRYRDSTTESTILERAFLPLDAHSFAKVIEDNNVIEDNTPFDEGEITICNTTYAASGASKDITGAPLIRVARGRWPRWSANERWQCVWRNEKGQGIQGDRPREGDEGLGRNNYRARVEVCVSDDGTPCENYPGSDYDKPVGLLHEYASSIDFGLISGSYAKNRSGGVLRSNVRSFLEELDVATGVFKPDVSGIVSNIDAFRVSRYSFSSGTYDGDSCGFGKKAEDFGNGECSSWGNPLAEMTLEAIRYLTGETSPMSGFSVGSGVVEESYVAGLTSPAWTGNDSNDWCAAHSMVLMNASEASFDADELGGWTRLAASGIEASTDDVGEEEGLAGAYFIGEAGSNVNKQCTAKDIVGLGGVQGICPTAPGLEGSYHVAGLAKYAYENLVVKDPDDDAQGNNISTYAVRLSSNIPEIRVRVRDDDDDDDWDGDGDDWGNDGWDGGQQNDRVITIVPACESYSTGDQVSGSGRNINPNRIGKCAIVDFRVSESDDEDDDDRDGRGSFDVIWEDSEFGGDYDSDLVMTLEYRIDGNNLRIRTDVDNQSTSQIMGVGYIVSGTEDDGFHVHSGINGYDRYECGGNGNGNGNGNGSGNDECRINDGDSEQRYRISDSSSGNFLRPPLYYAAGYGNDGVNEDGSPSAYFEVSRVGELVDSLQEVLDQVLRSSARSGSGLGFSASSGDTLFQTIYNNVNSWSGDLLAFSISDEGVSSTPLWSARKAMPSPDERTIIAWLYGDGRPFRMQGELEPYVNYLRGDPQDEQRNGGFLRNRLWLDGSAAPLGDIVGSQPYYAGRPDTYHVPAENDTSYAEFRTAYSGRTPVVYVGANDGMLHGFNAETGEELLAYIPGILLEAEPNYGALARLIDPNYLHRYYVDGSPTVLDVRLDGEWISLLASGLGSGGKGIFALDVTDPSAFSEDADNAAKIALWEFGPKDDEKLNGGEHLGFVYDRPSIVQLENGDHAVVFGNGYFSESGKASLYILPVDAYEEDDGEWEWDKDEVIRLTPGHVANAGLNGLSSVSMIDSDDNGRMDLAYAGDLQGNVWRFDLSDDSASEWDEDGNISLLFRAASAGGTAQVITTGLEVGAHPEGGVMLYFGTGGPEGESTPTSQSHDTLYAVRDRAPFEPTSPLGRDDLSERDLVTSNAEIRYFPLGNTYGEDTSTWGWFVDLPDHERAVSRPLLRGDRIIFTTLIPGIGLCGAEDEGYLYELKAHSGAAPNRPLIDTNGDGQINAGDTLSVDGSQVVPVGVKTEGALFTPVVRSDDSGKREVKVSVNTAGDIQRIVEQSLNRLRLGRASWRILE